jgi:hypothetical protein
MEVVHPLTGSPRNMLNNCMFIGGELFCELAGKRLFKSLASTGSATSAWRGLFHIFRRKGTGK